MTRTSTVGGRPARLPGLLALVALLAATQAGLTPYSAHADALGGSVLSGTISYSPPDLDPLDPAASVPSTWAAGFRLSGPVLVGGQLVEVSVNVPHADFRASGRESVLGGSGTVQWRQWWPISSSTQGTYTRHGDTIVVDIDGWLSGYTASGQHVSFRASLAMTMQSALLGLGGVCGFTCNTPFIGEWHVTDVVDDLV